MRRKPKSIRSKIILSLVPPVLALSTLWGLNVAASIGDALALRSAYSLRDEVGRPCDRLVEALQAERSQSQEFLAVVPGNVAALRASRGRTDAAIAQFRRLSSGYDGTGVAGDIIRARIADMVTNLPALTRIRTQIDAGGITRAEALSGYSTVISYAFSVLSVASSSSDPMVERVMNLVVSIRHVGELFSQEDALVTGAATAGRFGNGEYTELVEIVGALRFQIPTAGSALPEQDQAAYYSMLSNPTFTAMRTTEDRIVQDGRSGGKVPITTDVWKATFNPAAQQMYDFMGEGYDRAVTFAQAAGNRILVRFGFAGVLGLVAILLSLFVSIRVGGSVVHRLSVLRAAATDLAVRRLPGLVARLRSGEQIDVDDDVPRLPLGDDEIAEVGAALHEVQRSAIDSAVGEAAVRYGMVKVLVNVARRNQTLIDRQLEVITQIQSSGTAEERPVVRVRRLATRMRRNAEHLVILAGSARSGRGLHPEPLAEIIGRAVNQIEDGDRIQIDTIADAAVPGRALADLVHLLAELMENATSFSPPDTPVRVLAHRQPDGCVAVEIEDRGLGMSPAALEETNRRLAEPPDFDPANSARLGLIVVAQLAAHRGIRVGLRPSSFGGITAAVTLPRDLAEATSTPAPSGTWAGNRHRADAV